MSRAEGRWLALATLAVLAVAEIPYAIAYRQALDGWIFSGMLWAPHDAAQYWAAMREGAASTSWLVHDRFSGEPHQPVLMYPLYVGLGKLAAALSLPLAAAYHAAEVLARGALVVSVYSFCAALFADRRLRWVAFALVLGSSGVGFLAQLVAPAPATVDQPLGLFAKELNEPEMSTFLVLFTPPHLMLGLALLLLVAVVYLRAWARAGGSLALQLGVLVAGLGLVNPFSLVTLAAILPVHLALQAALHRQAPPPAAARCVGATLLVAAPFLAYSARTFAGDGFWGATYGTQNVLLSGTPLSLLVAFGAVAPLAAIGTVQLARRRTPAGLLVATWIVVSLTLMFAPVNVQRRFGFGLHPLLAAAAAVALVPALDWVRRERRGPAALLRPALSLGLLAALFSSAAASYAVRLAAASQPAAVAGWSSAFTPRVLQDAAAWLSANVGPEDVILAETTTGNFLGGAVPARVFSGHWVATARFASKDRAAQAFFRGALGPAGSVRLLADERIRFVVYGPNERALGGPPDDSALPLALVYRAEQVAIYEVNGAGPQSVAGGPPGQHIP